MAWGSMPNRPSRRSVVPGRLAPVFRGLRWVFRLQSNWAIVAIYIGLLWGAFQVFLGQNDFKFADVVLILIGLLLCAKTLHSVGKGDLASKDMRSARAAVCLFTIVLVSLGVVYVGQKQSQSAGIRVEVASGFFAEEKGGLGLWALLNDTDATPVNLLLELRISNKSDYQRWLSKCEVGYWDWLRWKSLIRVSTPSLLLRTTPYTFERIELEDATTDIDTLAGHPLGAKHSYQVIAGFRYPLGTSELSRSIQNSMHIKLCDSENNCAISKMPRWTPGGLGTIHINPIPPALDIRRYNLLTSAGSEP